MLNYVAALFLNYLIFDTLSYWRDTSSPGAEQFPQGKPLPEAATWPTFGLGTSLVIPFGLLVAGRARGRASRCCTSARASASRPP